MVLLMTFYGVVNDPVESAVTGDADAAADVANDKSQADAAGDAPDAVGAYGDIMVLIMHLCC